MSQAILPVFRSHYSICQSSLSLEPPGKSKVGGPASVFDLAVEAGLKEVVVIDSRIDGFMQALRSADAAKVQLIYGIQLVVCADMADKSLDSRRTESSVIVFLKNTAGYSDALRIWSRAWGAAGHIRYRLGGEEYAYGRADWRMLNTFWTPNLVLALPYTSSFIAMNTLTFNQITPDLPATPWVFREVGSHLPEADLIDPAIDRYVAQNPEATVVPIKTVCYATKADFKAYAVLRCIGEGSSWEDGVRGLCSDAFSMESWRELSAARAAAPEGSALLPV